MVHETKQIFSGRSYLPVSIYLVCSYIDTYLFWELVKRININSYTIILLSQNILNKEQDLFPASRTDNFIMIHERPSYKQESNV